jgi:hypothetical protein
LPQGWTVLASVLQPAPLHGVTAKKTIAPMADRTTRTIKIPRIHFHIFFMFCLQTSSISEDYDNPLLFRNYEEIMWIRLGYNRQQYTHNKEEYD